ncbi:hypothetical protein V1291_004723 [Nitrobacteraceae bacterium AZCC 1564]
MLSSKALALAAFGAAMIIGLAPGPSLADNGFQTSTTTTNNGGNTSNGGGKGLTCTTTTTNKGGQTVTGQSGSTQGGC